MTGANVAAHSTTVLTAYGLQCEYRTTPMGIGETRPRLSWRLRSSRRGDRASAHRVVVLRLTAAGEPAEQVWDSGWLAETASGVVYAGAPLESSTRYQWRLLLRDVAGDPAEPATAWFETGFLHRSDWTARWISRDPESAGPVDPPTDDDILGDGPIGHLNRRLPPCAFLRTTFETKSVPVRARLFISAKGLYEARLNGGRIGDHELAPGWTDYRCRIQYQCYDVTDMIVAGRNALGAILGDGWFCGRVGPGGRVLGEHYGSSPELIAQLQLDHADGRRQVVATDARWCATVGPLRFSDLLAGEYVDARRDLGGWDQPGYDASGWPTALVRSADASLLVASSDEPVRVMELLKPRAIERRPGGRCIVDLGQNMVGKVRVTLRHAAPGTRVILRHGEALTAGGDLYTANLRLAAATDVYVAAGGAAETFEPRFTCHGFRYVELAGYPGELDPADLTGVVLHSDTPRAGDLTTSDALVNQLMSNIWWSQRGNFVSIPTDCPQRDERLGWLADAQVFLPTACYNAHVAAFFSRWMRDVVSSRLPGGAFPDVAPRLVFEREGAPGWGDAGVIIPWQLWRTYGDRRVLEYSFPAMAGWIEHVRSANPELLWRNQVGNHYGDWLSVDATTPREVLATAYFAHSASLVARAADVLGETGRARSHRELAARIAAAFRAHFVAPDGRIAGDTQTGYLLALAFGLLTPDLADAAAGLLAADIERRGNGLTTGFLGVALLCPVLTAYGRADLAYALLHQDAYPSWNYSIAHGATTIWERWDGWTPERGFQSVAMNSLNHYSLGSVGEWLYRSVAGIGQSATSVAFADLDIRPVPGGKLTSARAHYESVRGRIESAWHTAAGFFHLTVLVPPGVTATIVVPTRDPATVRESGRLVDGAPDIAVVGADEAGLTCRVDSGRYQFVAAR